MSTHREVALSFINDFVGYGSEFQLDGKHLTISELVAICEDKEKTVSVHPMAVKNMEANSQYLQKKVQEGASIYGINTGFGGSADVRSNDILEIQRSLVRHLNAGFGRHVEPEIVKAVMVVRANSLARAYSGVRPQVVSLLLDMVNKNIIPVVPLRGSISASGDLMPTSYICAVMMGRPDTKALYNGDILPAPEALKAAGLQPIVFQAKEALATLNSASFASSVGARVLFDGSVAILLTQVATALSVESLLGRTESFHPTVHECLHHKGNKEVAENIAGMLQNSKFAQQELDIYSNDREGRLKQDRYAIRSSPQWMGPVVETMVESIRRITTEINSATDNPLIDHTRDEILHCANFQGISITVAMDQARQSIQLCGKLLFAQHSEILNVHMSNGLPPNLCGSDPNTDFGYKGTDTAMASYMSELDFLTNNVTNHVLSAEMHNQAINSMGLVSARYSSEALEILQMMIANILNAHVQAIDLRYLQKLVQGEVSTLLKANRIKEEHVPAQVWPWYTFVFTPEETARRIFDEVPHNGIDRLTFIQMFKGKFGSIYQSMIEGEFTDVIIERLGQG